MAQPAITAVVITRKRGRPKGGRAFDHDLARRMHANGMPLAEIGRALGVARNSVRYVCSKPVTSRTPTRLQLAGPPLPVSDERWRELVAWFERRNGTGSGNHAPERVEIRRWTPRALR